MNAWQYFWNQSMELKLLVFAVVLFVISRFTKKWKEKAAADDKSMKLRKETHEWMETGWSAVLIAAFIMYFFIQAFKIPSGSMRNTLLEGDHLFVNKFIYGLHIPLSDGKRVVALRKVQYKDIVVFKCPPQALSPMERDQGISKDFIKRCVALGGDVVEIKNKRLFVNGKPVEEPYLNFTDRNVYPSVKIFSNSSQYQRAWESGQFANLSPDVIRDNFGPAVVPAGHYFVMGDNRDRSFDSRFWGPLPDKYLKGRALLLYWPLKRLRIIR
ncbi:MAG: signal peptidase I [Elusimicrobiota bacterium]